MECESECMGMCKYLQIRQGKSKCMTNLLGFLSVYRLGEPQSFGHGSGHRIDDGGSDDDDGRDDKDDEKKKDKPAPPPPPPPATKSPGMASSALGSQKAPAEGKKEEDKGPFGFKFPSMSPGGGGFGKK